MRIFDAPDINRTAFNTDAKSSQTGSNFRFKIKNNDYAANI